MVAVCQYRVPDETAMIKLAAQFSACLTAPLLLTFKGEIGTGKTTFIRAMLRALGITGSIKSPTFSLVESYMHQHLLIHHFDLYRIQDEVELEYLGFRDFLSPNAICCIEWPERTSLCLGMADIACSFSMEGSGRCLDFNAITATGKNVLACVNWSLDNDMKKDSCLCPNK